VDPRSGSLIRYAAAAEVPWRNGGGRTRELHAAEGWRLSVATISDAGEFSAFPGRDRTLVVGRGRLSLSIGARGHQRLVRGDRVDFAGEAAVVAEPVGGPAAAVNVMARRADYTAAVRVVRLDGAAPSADAVVLLAGPAALQGEELNPFDAVLSPGAGALCGCGALVVIVSIAEVQS
jgi:environmental stress-induced protein Ves